MNDNLSAEETLKLASSQWASANDIMKLGRVGRNKSYAITYAIIHEIALSYYKDTKLRNRGLVPMSEVLKYFGIDLDYLKGVVSYDK